MNPATKVASLALVLLVACERPSTGGGASTVVPADTAVKAAPDSSRNIVSGATRLDSAGVRDSVVGDADDDYVPPIEDSTALSCAPKSLGPRDTLTLRMETPHGGELSIHSPDDVFYVVVAPEYDTSAARFAVVPNASFKTMSTLKVPADLRLPPRLYGRDTIPEPVFNRSGEYTVLMGENMASDHTGPPFICKISVQR
jgi:hypothetical protein